MGVADDLEDVAAEERLAAGEDRQGLGGECGDLIDDAAALLGGKLGAVGEGVILDERLAAGVEVAVLAREVARVRQVPRDDVRAREGVHAHIPKRALASSSTLRSISRYPLSSANFSIPERAIGRTNSGTESMRAEASAVQRMPSVVSSSCDDAII